MNNLRRELELLLLLTENRDYTVQLLADRLDITRRQLYYDLENLRACGFKLVKTNTRYRLDRHSSFFKRLHENIALTEEEAMFVYRLLDRLPHTDYLSKNIQSKLERFFNLELLTDVGQRRQAESNAAVLREAIELRRVVILKNYSSPHSHTVSDRMVEPFLFLNAEMDIRCFEINSHTNKTFKTSRAASVEMTDVEWLNEKSHKAIFTDIFMFSGEDRLPVKLKLGRLSHSILLEEYPMAEAYITPADDPDHWIFSSDVASYLGIGRFVLGLYHDIEVLGNPDFVAYIYNKVKGMVEKVGQ
ncbi:helix-turn-helix transcriptional regulator [Hoylesella loescheii]|jgi:hypothetical protein|uniref:HTH domain protein n=1 Tax=Hoylesella loescheii DSM 19665 = JCM 12249 = ATCC 15930 TaxID=1122985 RepID=A0A069QFF7_HOYLO|nr:WYL domain-containing protein [Hoylesella loescheii]KDR51603.1 HTH domain protein [Hoylesella loescheii DSM 19665 = JCM 12249 = ATCC 15930]